MTTSDGDERQEGGEQEETPRGGPGPFTEEEVAAATSAPEGDSELEGLEPVPIDEAEVEAQELAFERLVQRGKKLSDDRVTTVLESLLFVSERPLTVEQLVATTGFDRERIESGLQRLAELRRDGLSGIALHEIGGAWQLRTHPDSAEYVRRFLQVKPQRLTRAAVETLAIIAYRQPVTRPEIEDIRGVDCGAVMKALLERKLVKILGKKDEVGRPILYGTTPEFLEFFALRDLSALPTLREFHELTEEHRKVVEKESPAAAPPPKGTLTELADPEFEERLRKSEQSSEAALEELEAAIASAEVSGSTAEQLLKEDAAGGGEPPAPEPTKARSDEGPVAK